jgi:hypothetical protein
MFSTPPLARAKGLPLKVPPDQLNTPLIATAFVKLMVVPLAKLMVSVETGTPTGVQLVLLNQSLETEPFQVNVAAEQQPTFSKTERQSRANRITGASRVPRFVRTV